MKQDTTLPLKGIVVLDLTRFRAGPTCVRQLADWGANVIKVEQPFKGKNGKALLESRNGSDFQNLHRNKRSIAINLKSKEGHKIFSDLVARADIVVENFRPKIKQKLGIDYTELKKINSRLIYASISGYGQTGPYADRPGFDQVAQGIGGLMSVTGFKDQGPIRAGIPIADLSAGLYSAIGILLALFQRQNSGEGQWIRTSLLQSMVSMMDFQGARWLYSDELPGQAGNDHPTTVPTGLFQTLDGYINIATAGDEIYARLCEAIKTPELINKIEFSAASARSENRSKLNEIIAEKISKYKTSYWVSILNKSGVPCGPINKMDDVFSDPQVIHLELAKSFKHKTLGTKKIMGQAIEYGDKKFEIIKGAPMLGEHTDEILKWLGYDTVKIDILRDKKTVN